MSARPLAALAVAAAFALPLAAPARAEAAGPMVHLSYSASGAQPWSQNWNLGMRMNAPADAPASFLVRRCAPGAASCDETVLTRAGDDTAYAIPAQTPVGTSWEVTATAGEETTTVRSDAYRGRNQVLAPPTVNGAPVADGAVTVTPASWSSGGIGVLTRGLQLQACANSAAVTCAVLAESFWVPTVPEAAWTPAQLIVPARYTGWLLRVVDRLVQPEDRIPWVAVPMMAPPPPPPVDQRVPWARDGLTTISDFTAPVAPAPVVKPVPRPAPNRARTSISGTLTLTGRRTLATVRCTQDCAVRVTVRGGRRSASVVARARAGRALAVALPARALRRLAARRLRVTVVVDGTTIARGETTLAPRLLARLRG